jgi:hypothetical protein
MLATKKAGLQPAGNQERHTPTYAPARTPSRRFCSQFFPGPRDRPAQPPTRSTTAVGDALAFLVLGLQREDLTPGQRHRGWAIAERWLSEFVEGKQVEAAA